jgi:GTP-binding protein
MNKLFYYFIVFLYFCIFNGIYMKNMVAIVGRPNVGKSTLFNRLIGERNAIVEDTPGVTRDRIYGTMEWNGKIFSVIDTGGFIPGSENQLERAIREQAMLAIEEANVVVMLCDGRDGVTPFDQDIASILRLANKPVVLVINKCDNAKQQEYAYEFHSLGIGEPFPISATNGLNTGDFLDEITNNLNSNEIIEEDNRLKIAIVGRPNVGKSSLSNALLGFERSIVTPIAGTTRDSIDSIMKYYGEEIVLIDTAGLRVTEDIIEKEGMERTKKQIKEADVVVYIFDLTQNYEISDIDFYKTYITDSLKSDKKVIILFNKCDLFDNNLVDAFDEEKLTLSKGNLNFDKNNLIKLSATNKDDIEKLRDRFVDLVSDFSSTIEDNRIVTNVRHRDSLKEARASLLKSIEAISLDESNEFVAVYFRRALNALGEITGSVTTDDILNNIFSNFCIGK